MSQKKRAKWVDPRTPVSVTQIGKYTVTIYDQAAYDASLKDYPDDPDEKPITKTNNATSQFKKSKPQSRYNWTTPLNIGSGLPMIRDETA
jgi:hypothetical protein